MLATELHELSFVAAIEPVAGRSEVTFPSPPAKRLGQYSVTRNPELRNSFYLL